MKKEIAFLGYYCDSEKYDDKVLSNADNSFQYGYIKSLSKYYNLKKYSTNNIHDLKNNYIEDDIVYIGGKSTIKKTINLYKQLKNEKMIVYYNNLFMYNFVCYMLKKIKKTKYIIIMITDPYNMKNISFAKKIIFKIYKSFSKKVIKNADGLITITDKMFENKKRLVINGGINQTLLDEYKACNKKQTIQLLYTGNLYYRYNLDLIIDTVNKYNKINFDIYGDGTEKNNIEKKQNKIVKYNGSVSKKDIIPIQKSAVALIALLNTDELSKETFPSKIFEYLATGNEVIVSDLETLDKEIKELCHVVKKINAENLKEKLIDIFEKKHYKNNIEKSYNLLSKKYTWESYSEKLKDFIESCDV